MVANGCDFFSNHLLNATSAQLKHPHVLPLIEVYESKDSIYLVLELVTGGELFDKVRIGVKSP